MKIQVENYYGNDILTLVYNEKDTVISGERMGEIDALANHFGYDVADLDTDENGHQMIRVQEANVDNSEDNARQDLLNMVTALNKKYL